MKGTIMDRTPITTAPQRIVISAAEYDALVASLDAPPRDLPRLRALLAAPDVFTDARTT